MQTSNTCHNTCPHSEPGNNTPPCPALSCPALPHARVAGVAGVGRQPQPQPVPLPVTLKPLPDVFPRYSCRLVVAAARADVAVWRRWRRGCMITLILFRSVTHNCVTLTHSCMDRPHSFLYSKAKYWWTMTNKQILINCHNLSRALRGLTMFQM